MTGHTAYRLTCSVKRMTVNVSPEPLTWSPRRISAYHHKVDVPSSAMIYAFRHPPVKKEAFSGECF